MPLTPAEVETAYRLIMGRMPSPEETANTAKQHDKPGTLRQSLLNSDEFYRKFAQIRLNFTKRLQPVLMHLHIPEAVDQALFDALATAEALQPATLVDTARLVTICATPRPERLKLHYLYGDLVAGCGADLGLPYTHLCAIADPGPRLYRLYRSACDSDDNTELSFGSYLEYSLESVPHRLELDNGQVRRLSGQQDRSGLGRETELLPRALHNAMAPDMILGVFERPKALADRLVKEGFLSNAAPTIAEDNTPDAAFDKHYAAALENLSADARTIFETYTAWDNYLYSVCKALLFPVTE